MNPPQPARAVILGSGTSTGVPVIGCGCGVCTGGHPDNQRTRASLMLEVGRGPDAVRFVIDTGPDFRAQMLRERVGALSAVFYTHMHADHVHGFDDLRAFSFDGRPPVACYLHRRDAAEFRRRFSYAFEDTGYRGALPALDLRPFDDAPFTVAGVEVEPVTLPHGAFFSTGFRFGRFAYITDFKAFPDEVAARWRGRVTTVVASGIHFGPHGSHSNIPETCALLARLGAARGVITHLAHEVDAPRDAGRLPAPVVFARDGMAMDVEI